MTTTPQSGRPSSAAANEAASGTPIQAAASTSTSTAPATAAAPGQLPELPWAFIDCPADTLVVLIAHMLDLLCQHNDQVVLTPDALTRFHSRAPPGISVIEYLRRIVKYTNLEKIPLLSLLAYIDLTCQNLPTFTLSSLTVHRFLIAGVTAGSKAQCDVFCTNAHYAKVGGIKVGELNNLEREFLRVTGWALCCNSDLLQRYYTSLIRSHGGYVQAPEPEVSPFRAFPDAGKEAPTDSQSATPVQQTGSAFGDEAAEEGEADDDMGENEGEEEDDDGMDSGSDSDSPDSGPSRGRKVRGATDGDPAMEVDTPAAEIREEPSTSVPGNVTEASPAAPVLTDGPTTAEPTHAPITHSSTSRSLKSLMGGMFKRSSDQSSISNSTSTSAGAQSGSGSSPKVLSASPKPIVRSKPLASPRLNGTPMGAVGPGGASENGGSKPVTPRVRTREERSVDSLRGGIPAAAAGVDDSKTRARYE